MLKSGDKCHVRNWRGEIEECRYSHVIGRSHTVYDKTGGIIMVSGFKPRNIFSGRFVCMTGLNKGSEK